MNNNLFEKYWNAETSLQEEEQILNEQQLQGPEAHYFAFIAEARKQKSMLSIDDIDAFNLKQTLNASKATVRPLYRWMASAAAVMIFAFSAFGVWKYSQSTQQEQMAETFDNPYEAYEEMRQALAFVSSKLNHSQNEALVNIQKAGEYAEMFK